jgi:peroxiredoxin
MVLLAFSLQAAEPGPAVGSKAAAFSLSDQTGTVRSLESLMGKEGLMLVFYRSADW